MEKIVIDREMVVMAVFVYNCGGRERISLLEVDKEEERKETVDRRGGCGKKVEELLAYIA